VCAEPRQAKDDDMFLSRVNWLVSFARSSLRSFFARVGKFGVQKMLFISAERV